METRRRVQSRINQMKRENVLTDNGMRYIVQLLCREKEKFTQTNGNILFDLANFSDKTVETIKLFLDVTDKFYQENNNA